MKYFFGLGNSPLSIQDFTKCHITTIGSNQLFEEHSQGLEYKIMSHYSKSLKEKYIKEINLSCLTFLLRLKILICFFYNIFYPDMFYPYTLYTLSVYILS